MSKLKKAIKIFFIGIAVLISIIILLGVGLFLWLDNTGTKRYLPDIKIEHAKYITPTQTYPINICPETAYDRNTNKLKLCFKEHPISLSLFLFPSVKVLLNHLEEESMVELDNGESYYQQNKSDPTVLRFNNPKTNRSWYDAKLPEPLSKIQLVVSGGYFLPESALETVKSIKKDKHRIYLSFIVDGEPHIIDVEFKIGLKRTAGSFMGAGIPN